VGASNMAKNIAVSDRTHNKAKHIAVDLGVSLITLFDEMLDAYLELQLIKQSHQKKELQL